MPKSEEGLRNVLLLLIVLVQAEHVWCSLPNEAQRFQHGNTYAGLQLLDEEPRKLSNPQNKVRRILVSPNLLKNHFSNVRPSVKQGSSKGLPTRSYLEVLSQPAQGSARLVKSHLVPRTSGRRPASLQANAQAESKHLGRKRAWADVRGSPRSYPTSLSTSRERYSFSPASLSAAEKPTMFSEMGSPAFLFGPVAPGSHGSAKMQTYARGPATRVYSNSASPGLRAGSSFLRNVAPNQGSEARSWLRASAPSRTSLGLAVPRSVQMGVPQDSATVYEIPSQYGGFAIRRVKEPDNQKQAGQMLQQISKPAPQLMVAYPNFPNGHLETKWSRLSQHKL
uniref:Uncharacterized protein n=1 Tax=Nothobranchius rachovii TaxID=451742 RepID=A0A1A8PE82_9TELE